MLGGVRGGFPCSLPLIISANGRDAALIVNDGLYVKLPFLWKNSSFVVSNTNNTFMVKLNVLMINIKLR